jgi:hypothetical protein
MHAWVGITSNGCGSDSPKHFDWLGALGSGNEYPPCCLTRNPGLVKNVVEVALVHYSNAARVADGATQPAV